MPSSLLLIRISPTPIAKRKPYCLNIEEETPSDGRKDLTKDFSIIAILSASLGCIIIHSILSPLTKRPQKPSYFFSISPKSSFTRSVNSTRPVPVKDVDSTISAEIAAYLFISYIFLSPSFYDHFRKQSVIPKNIIHKCKSFYFLSIKAIISTCILNMQAFLIALWKCKHFRLLFKNAAKIKHTFKITKYFSEYLKKHLFLIFSCYLSLAFYSFRAWLM